MTSTESFYWDMNDEYARMVEALFAKVSPRRAQCPL